MKRAIVVVLLAGLVAVGCVPGAAIYEDGIVNPAEQDVAMMPVGGGTVQLAELGPVTFRLGALISAAWPQDDEFDFESTTFQLDALFQADLPMNLGIDARVGFLTYEADEGTEEVDTYPVSVMLTYRFGLGDMGNIYIGMGVAYLFNDLEDASGDLDDAVGFKAALGANFTVVDKFAIGVDASYLTASADTDDLVDEEWTMDNVTLGVAFMFRF
jgi:opacity protein-like surface antigen